MLAPDEIEPDAEFPDQRYRQWRATSPTTLGPEHGELSTLKVHVFDAQAQPIAYGPRDPKAPHDQRDPTVIVMRRVGKGKMVVIADSEFATNQNLEREGGEPFEGMRENADFWRWLITYLNEQPVWRPPKPAPPATAPAAPAPASQ